MKSRLVLAAILLFLTSTRPAHAAGDASVESHERTFTSEPDAASRSLELINRERSAAGVPSLGLDDEVKDIAAGWSRKMAAAGRLSHNSDYLSEESMRRLNATIVGENVAYADTVDRTHELFMNSPPHRRNILHPDYRLVGIAAVRGDDGQVYLTQDFLTRNSAPTEGRPAAEARPADKPRPNRARPARPGRARPGPAATRARATAPPPRPTPTPTPTTTAPTTSTTASTTTTTVSPPPAAGAGITSAQPAVPVSAPAAEPVTPVAHAPTALLTERAATEGAQPHGRSSPSSAAAFWQVAPLLGLALWPRRRRR